MKAFMVALFAIGLVACTTQDPGPKDLTSTPDDPAEVTPLPEDTDLAALWNVSTPADPSEAVGAEADATNCVYIDWCNEPGANGTVCRVRATCRSQGTPSVSSAVISECSADARFACGTIIQPARIFCD